VTLIFLTRWTGRSGPAEWLAGSPDMISDLCGLLVLCTGPKKRYTRERQELRGSIREVTDMVYVVFLSAFRLRRVRNQNFVYHVIVHVIQSPLYTTLKCVCTIQIVVK
jgi:hypothetical protein